MKKLMMTLVTLLVLCLGGIIWLCWPEIKKFDLPFASQSETATSSSEVVEVPKTPADFGVIEGMTLIGDSVALRAQTAISELYPTAQFDAEVNRNFYTFAEIYQAKIADKSLLSDVVVAIGVNVVNDYEAQIQSTIDNLPEGHRLIFVTPYFAEDPTGISRAQRDFQLSLPDKYPYVYIADWYQTAVDHPEIWTDTDGVHFGSYSETIIQGGQLYAQTIQAAVNQALEGPVKGQ